MKALLAITILIAYLIAVSWELLKKYFNNRSQKQRESGIQIFLDETKELNSQKEVIEYLESRGMDRDKNSSEIYEIVKRHHSSESPKYSEEFLSGKKAYKEEIERRQKYSWVIYFFSYIAAIPLALVLFGVFESFALFFSLLGAGMLFDIAMGIWRRQVKSEDYYDIYRMHGESEEEAETNKKVMAELVEVFEDSTGFIDKYKIRIAIGIFALILLVSLAYFYLRSLA